VAVDHPVMLATASEFVARLCARADELKAGRERAEEGTKRPTTFRQQDVLLPDKAIWSDSARFSTGTGSAVRSPPPTPASNQCDPE
jgi:hypothetical protein